MLLLPRFYNRIPSSQCRRCWKQQQRNKYDCLSSWLVGMMMVVLQLVYSTGEDGGAVHVQGRVRSANTARGPHHHSRWNDDTSNNHNPNNREATRILLPRGAAEALHDDALSQLPTLATILGSLHGFSTTKNNNHKPIFHPGMDDDDDDNNNDDDDLFLPWDSATAPTIHTRRRRRRSYLPPRRRRQKRPKLFNISNLLQCCLATEYDNTNNMSNNNNTLTINSTTNVNSSTVIMRDHHKGVAADNHNNTLSNTAAQAIEGMMNSFLDSTDHIMITNKSFSNENGLIKEDNTTPTTPIIVVSGSSDSTSTSTTTNSSSNLQEASIGEVSNQNITSIPSAQKVSPSSPAVETPLESDDEEIGSMAVDYASKSAGAIILEKSHSFKGTSNLLNYDRDRYAIAPCQDKKKYVVIGLSEDILVKTVKLANYERYSSHLKTFSIWGSQTTKEWVDLGTYEARFGLGEQSFDLLQPSWARYLKFKFLTHYGSEHYCTISQIKVHGHTMVQGFHEQWSESTDEEEDDENEKEERNKAQNSVDETNELQQEDSLNASGKNPKHQESEQRSEDRLKHVESSSRAIDHNGQESSIPTQSEGSTNDPSVLTSTVIGLNEEESSTSHVVMDDNNGTCDSLHIFSFGRHDSVLQSASFVLSSTSRMAESSLGHSIPDISKGSLAAPSSSVPSTLSSHAQTLRDAAARSIGNSQLFSAAVEKIQVVATALGDSLDINVSSLGLLGRKADSDKVGDKQHDAASTAPVHVADTAAHTANEPAAPTAARVLHENDHVASDARAEGTLSSPADTSGDPIVESSKHSTQQRQVAAEEPGVQDMLLQDLPPLVAQTLRRLPSADCLQKLDLGEFQAKMAASRKGGSKHAGSSQGGNAIEPIFKTLTDQIKALQLTLSVQEQFTKSSITCYQQVLADLALEIESTRATTDARLMRLEREMQELQSISLVILVRNLAVGATVVVHFIAGLVADLVVLTKLDIRIKMFLAGTEIPPASQLASIVCSLFIILFIATVPRKSNKKAPSVAKASPTRSATKSNEVHEVPYLVNMNKEAQIIATNDLITKNESLVVLADLNASSSGNRC